MKACVEEIPADRPDAGWDAFVEVADNGTLFALTDWCGAVATLTGQRLRRFVVCDGGGRTLAGLVLLVKSRLGLRLAIKPWATPYSGIAYSPDLSHRQRLHVNEALADHLAGQHSHVRLETPPGFHSMLAFERAGWSVSVRNTYRLTADGRSLLARIEPAAQRQVNKARRLGVSVAPSSDAAPLFHLYDECYRRQGVELDFGEAGFREFCGRLQACGRATLWYAFEGERPVAGMLVGCFRRIHYYCLAAFARDHQPRVGPTLLLVDYFERRVQAGEVLDLVGANAMTAGVTTFKSKFNPDEAPHLVLEWRPARYRWLYRPLWRLYAGVRRSRRQPRAADVTGMQAHVV